MEATMQTAQADALHPEARQAGSHSLIASDRVEGTRCAE
jgi:hypothetical protein